MTNTPAQIVQGRIAWRATPNIEAEEREINRCLLTTKVILIWQLLTGQWTSLCLFDDGRNDRWWCPYGLLKRNSYNVGTSYIAGVDSLCNGVQAASYCFAQ
mmetsp:Transcript_20792/g.30735  ORF Transcript_20792/g.30735 Transcript_20792/m.30735 type:complete len:101 (+) Transcript_20792:152-454(+)